MDYRGEYQTALELAASLRYEEAKQKLESILSGQPHNAEALVLLAKVEYYLRLFPSSIRHLETVLTNDPGNFEAYYGLQFFIERKKRLRVVTAWIISILLLFSITIFTGNSIKNRFDQLAQTAAQQNENYMESWRVLSDRMLALSDNLVEYSQKVNRLEQSLDSGTEVLNEHLDELDFEQKEQFQELQNHQHEYYRSISGKIKDLQEIINDLRMKASEFITIPEEL